MLDFILEGFQQNEMLAKNDKKALINFVSNIKKMMNKNVKENPEKK